MYTNRSRLAVLALIAGVIFCRPASGLEGEAKGSVDAYGDPLPAGAKMRLGTIRMRHGGWDASLIFTADGESIIAGVANRQLRFFDVATGKRLKTLQCSEELSGRVLALSPDGNTLAFGGVYGIAIWDLAAGKEVRYIKSDSVASLAFTPDGRTLISGGGAFHFNYTVSLWDVATGKELRRMAWHKGDVELVGCTPDGKTVISANTSEGKIHFADVATGRELRVIQESGRPLNGVALTSDGGMIAAAYRTYANKPTTIRFIDSSTGEEIRRTEEIEDAPRFLAFSPDGKTLAGQGYESSIQLWDTATAKPTRTLADVATGLVFSPDGKYIAGYAGGLVRIWDAESGKDLHPPVGHREEDWDLTISPDGTRLVSRAGIDKEVHVWDLTTAKQLWTLPHNEPVRAMTFLNNRETLVTGCENDDALHLWDIAAGTESRTLPLVSKQHMARICVSPDDQRLYAVSRTIDYKNPGIKGGTVTITASGWRLDTGKRFLNRSVDCDGFISRKQASIAPNGKLWAYRGPKSLIIADPATGDELHSFPITRERVLEEPYVFSPNGKLLAVRSTRQSSEGARSGGDKHSIRVFDPTTGMELYDVASSGLWAGIAFSPDSRLLAAAGRDGFDVWDAATGKLRYALHGPDIHVKSLAFSPDGKSIATGLLDTSILIWELAALKKAETPAP